eukprot:TRINITY_DN400_c0_g1_i2.p2 TRINITY_DN400_c0_g1~~TRINITY_DN400_c0_g1_i2.p2  ORF type:complete len:138 (+),score=28.50 TRINITY_DN400_c0_g1_i2:101-514(+)
MSAGGRVWIAVASFVVLASWLGYQVSTSRVGVMAGMPGGISDVKPDGQNSLEMTELAQFAVSEHNKKQNSDLKFVKMVSAKQQVVAGLMYYITLEASANGQDGLYEAKIWSKPWEKHKSLEDFKQVNSAGQQGRNGE